MPEQAARTIRIGSVLGGKYRLERVLGRGGMGAVYRAENIDIGRKVAIKVLLPELAREPHHMARFRNEARAAAAIGHPGIVDVLDLGQLGDGAAFIVMELLDGETLGARLRREKVLVPHEAGAIVDEIFAALAAAHAKGIVHRDLKPDNVFLVARPEQRVKILDFGISKLRAHDDVSITATGAVMGTPLYMSPEQARGERDVGPAADLYSAGALLYTALVGRPPFRGDSYNAVLSQVLNAPHTPIDRVLPGVPLELSSLVDCLLAKNPAVRPPDVGAAREWLRRALGDGLTWSAPAEEEALARTEARDTTPDATSPSEIPAGEAASRPPPSVEMEVAYESTQTGAGAARQPAAPAARGKGKRGRHRRWIVAAAIVAAAVIGMASVDRHDPSDLESAPETTDAAAAAEPELPVTTTTRAAATADAGVSARDGVDAGVPPVEPRRTRASRARRSQAPDAGSLVIPRDSPFK